MKKRPLSALKRELDKRFAQFIRKRDTNSLTGGFGRCITCGEWAKLECGHFIPRQHLATRWDERNSHGQCSGCNCWGHGRLTEYTLFMQKTYGQKVVDELLEAKRRTVKMTRADYEEMIARYA